ncbi:hypothetical protein [Aequorivita capsosiphonis]|uniref:hypothetical protein n=1 Tax=Aequorivita capsosiphonis TaxID=487317 RepID=UPI000417674A|nr:hypothetical protein [Aequorivita capsosiphonis]
MQKQFLLILAFFVFQIGSAQILDIFKNKSYEVSSYVLKEKFDKDYLPSEIEGNHDKLKDGNKDWEKIDTELKKIALERIENAVSFFEINANIKKQLQVTKDIAINYRKENEYGEPVFQNLKIKLLSVVNDFAIYALEYHFESRDQSNSRTSKKLVARYFYSANINTGSIENIDIKPNKEQQKILETLSISEFQKIYLLQTEKLEMNDVAKIHNPIQADSLFSKKIDYSEAIIFPYTAGVMLEFPDYSESSKILDGQSFRFLLKDKDLESFIAQFPKFKKYFSQNLKPASKTTKDRLADEQIYLDKFKSGPEELTILKLFDFDKKIYEMKIDNFQISDKEKRFQGSKIFLFNEDESIHLIENRDSKGEIHSEEKFTYTDFQELESVTTTGYRKNLTLYYYKNQELIYSEMIELEKQGNPYDSYKQTDLKIRQHHLIYNDKYRYDISFNLVGDISERINGRHNSENMACGNSHCLIYDSEERVVGVKAMKNGSVELLTDDDGKILESYFDSNRHQYFFTYDAKNRLEEIKYLESGNLKNTTIYQYHESTGSPLSILKEGQTTNEQVYSFKFRD